MAMAYGGFFKTKRINSRAINSRACDSSEVKKAMNAYLDGFFEAVEEFYTKISPQHFKTLPFSILDNDLERLFNEKLENYRQS